MDKWVDTCWHATWQEHMATEMQLMCQLQTLSSVSSVDIWSPLLMTVDSMALDVAPVVLPPAAVPIVLPVPPGAVKVMPRWAEEEPVVP